MYFLSIDWNKWIVNCIQDFMKNLQIHVWTIEWKYQFEQNNLLMCMQLCSNIESKIVNQIRSVLNNSTNIWFAIWNIQCKYKINSQ
jgi:hypothetical protein